MAKSKRGVGVVDVSASEDAAVLTAATVAARRVAVTSPLVRDLGTPTIRLTPITVTVGNVSQSSASHSRLLYHRAVLAAYGIKDLAALGKLTLSGNVVPQAGITHGQPAQPGPATLFQSARRVIVPAGARDGLTLQRFGGSATMVPASPLARPQAQAAGRMLLSAAIVPIDIAYWVATWIDLPNDTTVILKNPNRYLVIIAEKVTVGERVTFTWERPSPAAPPGKPARPADQPAAPTSITIAAAPPAAAGIPGVSGGAGPRGADGPQLEIWALELAGHPAFDLAGEDGSPGAEGGDGGKGGDGSPGRADFTDWLGFCKSGPGNGGDGGPGGAAGNGGPGGPGGDGGTFNLYAPQAVLTAYSQNFYATVDGGAPGAGGIPGLPGAGGAAGPRGDNSHGCKPSSPRSAGAPGAQGSRAAQGLAGQRGQHGVLAMNPISADEFRAELLKPAIVSLSSHTAKEGDTLTASGQNFASGDTISVDGIQSPTTILSDTLASFQVPSVAGGSRSVQLRRSDGSLSNPISLYIEPTLTAVSPTGKVKPGSVVQLTGTGFATGAIVRANGQDMPGTQVAGPTGLKFTLVRPTSVTINGTSEQVGVKVVLADGTPTNELVVPLHTFRTLVFGDSIAWGQGLPEPQKFSNAAEAVVRSKHGDIGVYETVLAHSGAIVGLTPLDNTVLPALAGEVPTSFPTIAEQVTGFAGSDSADDVDLILMDGGINDLGVTTILSPLTSTGAVSAGVEAFCHVDMGRLLAQMIVGIGGKPPLFPNTKVIVTGYYQIISEQSDTGLLAAFLMALGLDIASIPGAIVAGGISVAAKGQIVANCRTFRDQSNLKLRQAVNEVNSMTAGPPRAFLALPAFGPQNAALAPDPFIYGINADLSPQDDPSVSAPRATACSLAGSRTVFEICKRASIGHPNPKGAAAYAAAITPLL